MGVKKSEFQQIKNASEQELQKRLFDYREKLRKLKVDLFYGKVKNIKEIKDVKKTIARIMTILNKTI
ncbi:MAG: 50S ribosomal protein L29 [Patescibacteria group bacterium]|nr:50S ribosomal protein L29 [Patescibacteria group bacterium]